MSKTSLFNVSVIALLAANVGCGGNRGKLILDLDEIGKKEWIVLPVGMKNNKCVLTEKRPSEIRTDGTNGGSFVRWVVAGHCDPKDGKPQRIAIDGNFMQGPNSFYPFQSDGTVLEVDIPIAEGGFALLVGHVKPSSDIPEGKKGRYNYKVKINNEQAEFQSFADDGMFLLCPVWPCGL